MTRVLTATLAVTFGTAALTGVAYTASQPSAGISGGTSSATSSNPSAPGQVKKSATPVPTSSPAAEPPPKSLSLSPNPLSVTGLAPGVSLAHVLTVGNPNNQDVILQSVTANVLTPSPPPVNGLSCSSPADFEVVLTNVTPMEIKRNGSKSVPVAFRMNNSAMRNQDGCKGRTFTFVFTATATSK